VGKKIIMFHGRGCPPCQEAMPVINRLIEEGFEIEKLEVWHNEENEKRMLKHEKIIKKAWGGEVLVPVLVDEENNRAFPGNKSYEEIREWITEK